MALDRPSADAAARTVRSAGVSVADAHVGAAVQSASSAPGEVIALTSDPGDIARAADPAPVVTVRI